MSLDYSDRQALLEALDDIKDGIRDSTLQQQENFTEHQQGQTQMADAFNRIARALENLTAEVKGLREDLNPALDKSKKLPLPQQGN